MSVTIDPAASPYLQGPYEPIADELDKAGLRVRGELPERLRGTYLRNGPNPAFAPVGRYHLFDGDGMVHAVGLGDDTRYRNRFVESRGLAYERRQGRAVYGGLSQFSMPDPEMIAEGGMMKNTANTNVIRHAGRILALMEGGRPTELTESLETVGEHDYDGRLPGSMTAHPKLDPDTGELVFFAYSPIAPHLRFHVADPSGTLVTDEIIDTPRPTMMHDFVMTRRHVVFFDLPAIFDLAALMSGAPSISWQPQHPARIGLLPRDGGNDDVVWSELDPFFVFHFLNAWEDDEGQIQIVGCRAPSLPIDFGDGSGEGSGPPLLWRWTIDPSTGAVSDEQLDDQPTDFPRINDAFAGRTIRYGYTARAPSETTRAGESDAVFRFDGVIKYDLETGMSIEHRYPTPVVGGEPVFAADPAGTDEDSGWILNLATDHGAGHSELVVHDASDLEVVARVELPHRVPAGFHGAWLPD